MPASVPNPVLAELRARIRRLEGSRGHARPALPFGLEEIDRVLPEGGLALGALHEVAGGGNGAIDGAAAALFAAHLVVVENGTAPLDDLYFELKEGSYQSTAAKSTIRLSLPRASKHSSRTVMALINCSVSAMP
jgi:hypothetical protein